PHSGNSIKLSPGLEIYDLADHLATWDPVENILSLKPGVVPSPDIGTPQNMRPVAKFTAKGISEIEFERDLGTGLVGLTYLLVMGLNRVPFNRSSTQDCNGAVTAVSDTTSEGDPYVVNGTAVRCSDECYPGEMTWQACDDEFAG